MTVSEHRAWVAPLLSAIGNSLGRTADLADQRGADRASALLLAVAESLDLADEPMIAGLPGARAINPAACEILRALAAYARTLERTN